MTTTSHQKSRNWDCHTVRAWIRNGSAARTNQHSDCSRHRSHRYCDRHKSSTRNVFGSTEFKEVKRIQLPVRGG